MKIAVLDLTEERAALLADLPRVSQQIIDWLSPEMPVASFFAVDITGGAAMPPVADFDGLILSGSEYGVYDDTPWMAPLRGLLRHTKAAGKPIYGICFGHQIMAEVFGGRAEKAEIGKVVGARTFDIDGQRQDAHVWHQDQVTAVPPGATVTGHAPHCPVGVLDYDFPAKSVQFHPEYREDHLRELFARFRGDALTPDEIDAALASFERANVAADLAAREAAAFFVAALRG